MSNQILLRFGSWRAVFIAALAGCTIAPLLLAGEPQQLSVAMINLHPDLVKEKAHYLKGYLGDERISDVPVLYSSKANAKMDNRAEGVTLVYLGDRYVNSWDCRPGYVSLLGFLDRQDEDYFVVLAVFPFDEEWQIQESCWYTPIDWINSEDFRHLVP